MDNTGGVPAIYLYRGGTVYGTLGIDRGTDGGNQPIFSGANSKELVLGTNQNFATKFGVNNSVKMTIDTSGNVGIGTTSPTSKLHVVGDVTVTGNISAKYQDLAEWVPATEDVLPGTVVVLDLDRTNSVIASFKSYDTRVAGVVSSNPGIVLGEAAEGKVKVATTGRVKVQVDATSGPIKVGDLLVTSNKLGLAMRSEPVVFAGVNMHRPGTLIGKALEPLEKGTGEILVLLSLQ